MTPADAADLWLNGLRAGVSSRGVPYSAASLRIYAHHLHAFVAWLGNRALASLEADDLRDHLGAMRRDRAAPKSIAARETVLRLWFDWLAERQLIEPVSFARVRRVRAPEPPVVALSRAQVDALLAAPDRRTRIGLRDAAILHVLFGTGVRAAELCGLDLADYDRVGAITVRHGKGDKARQVGVPDDAVTALEEWLVLGRGLEEGPLFRSVNGEALKPAALRQIATRLGRAAGVPAFHPHQARHSYATAALRAGMDIYILSRALGHQSLMTTQIYLRGIQEEDAVADQRRVMNAANRGRRR